MEEFRGSSGCLPTFMRAEVQGQDELVLEGMASEMVQAVASGGQSLRTPSGQGVPLTLGDEGALGLLCVPED